MTAAPPPLQASGLCKRYGQRTALQDVSIAIPAGQWVALLGPNGAGKSTLFQLLTGLYRPDAGSVRVQGCPMHSQAPRALAHLGVVFQGISLDLDLSVERNLRLHAALHGLPLSVTRERIAQGAAALGLQAELARPARALSGGTRRKVELVRALLHRPSLLLMDEPTVGLDPASRRDLLAAVRSAVREHGTAVLWATHLVEETQAVDRVLVLHRGRLLADGTAQAVAAALGGGSLEDGFIQATRTVALNEETAP